MTTRSEAAPVSGDAVFRTIFEESPIGVALVSLEFRFLRVNPVFCAITGYAEPELLERTFVDITHPHDVDKDVALAGRLIAGAIPRYQTEKRYIRKDGEAVWVSIGASLVRDPGGAPLHIVATIQDISETKQAEAQARELAHQLREAKARYRQTLDAISDFVFVKDSDSRLAWANRAFCDYYGMSVEALHGVLDAPTTPAEVTSGYLTTDALVLATGSTEVVDQEPIVSHDGTVRIVNTVKSPLRSTDGRIVGLVGVARDLTDRQRLEEALARSERHFRALIENSGDMVSVLDRTGKNVYVSPANQRVVGWTSEERVGRDAFEIIHPDDQAKLRSLFERVIQEPSTSAVVEYRLRHRDGHWLWVEATGHNRLDDPAVRGVVVNVRDVSARRAVEEQLARSETHFRELIERSQDITTILDGEGVTRFASSSIEQVLGWRPDEVIGRGVFDFVHPDDATWVMRLFAERVRDQGARDAAEFRMRHKDGTWRYLEVMGHNLVDDPVIHGVVFHSRDVTARKVAEERQVQSEAYFRALIEQVSDAVTVLEPDGVMRYLSPSIRKILGYEPAELVGTTLLDLVHVDDQARIAADVIAWPTAPEEQAGSTPARFRARHKDGSWRYLEGTGRISLDDPVVRGVVGSVRDVTDRVAAEDERERLIGQLTEALEQVKTLQGLLPICSSCKRVRDDQGYWTQIESYLAQHSRAEFSHGICPRCAKQLYPEYFHDHEHPTDKVR